MSESARLIVHVQPRASKTEVAGWHGTAVKIRLQAPPVDGAANTALVAFLARRLRLPKAAVRIAAGSTGRRKTIDVAGISLTETLARLGVPLDSP